MAWDFSTEPEFQQKLDWMREFVREEIWPIETVFEELGQEGFERAIAPLQEQVKERGLWAAHLPPDLGGQGFGQVKLGLMHEILGSVACSRRRCSATPRPTPATPRSSPWRAPRTRRTSTCIRCSTATCARRSR